MSRGFWARFLLPGGIWLTLMFVIPLSLLLALSFGYTDDLGRAVYAFDFANYKDAFDPLYIPVLLRSIGYAVATAASACSSATRSPTTSPATGASASTC